MKNFEFPVIEVVSFTAEEILTASGKLPVGDNQTPWN